MKSNAKSEYIFPNPETGEPFQRVRRAFVAACRRAGIEGLRFHDLRHTFATRCIRAGVDIHTLKELLGHHSITVTERYLFSGEEQKRKAVNMLNHIASIP
jgi:integrase